MDLKKQSFALANEGSDNEGDEKKGDDSKKSKEEKKDGDKPAQTAGAKVEVKKEQEYDDGEDNSESDSDDEGAGGYQNNNMMAYKSVEIDQGLLRDEIFFIRKHKWKTVQEIFDSYDFGLLVVDCRPLKEEIINHCE